MIQKQSLFVFQKMQALAQGRVRLRCFCLGKVLGRGCELKLIPRLHSAPVITISQELYARRLQHLRKLGPGIGPGNNIGGKLVSVIAILTLSFI